MGTIHILDYWEGVSVGGVDEAPPPPPAGAAAGAGS